MMIKEYRIEMPFTVDEYEVAHSYLIAKATEDELKEGSMKIDLLSSKMVEIDPITKKVKQNTPKTNKLVHKEERNAKIEKQEDSNKRKQEEEKLKKKKEKQDKERKEKERNEKERKENKNKKREQIGNKKERKQVPKKKKSQQSRKKNTKKNEELVKKERRSKKKENEGIPNSLKENEGIPFKESEGIPNSFKGSEEIPNSLIDFALLHKSKSKGKGGKEKVEFYYTHRVFDLHSKLPLFLQKIVYQLRSSSSSSSFVINEHASLCYPFVKAVYDCPLLGSSRFEMEIETIYHSLPQLDNVFQIPSSLLSKRQIIQIDITTPTPATPTPSPSKNEDPLTYSFSPLPRDWQKNSKERRMCVYKLIKVKINYWPITSTLQSLLHNNLLQFYWNLHRTSYCTQHIWKKLSLTQLQNPNFTHNNINLPIDNSTPIESVDNNNTLQKQQPNKGILSFLPFFHSKL